MQSGSVIVQGLLATAVGMSKSTQPDTHTYLARIERMKRKKGE